METRLKEISSRKNKRIKIGIIPGHFATNHSHVNYYVDLDSIKNHYRMAKETASVIALQYVNTPVDTIICLEGTQMLGAFLADQLSESYTHCVNYGKDICVMTPEMNSNNQIIFRDNAQGAIWNKNVLLLISSASTGWTISRCIECLKYYNGNLVAVSSLFSAINDVDGIPVNAIFTKDDLSEYFSGTSSECPMCKAKQKVDAIINAYGYSKI